ncbi:MAG TPA: DUF58 domain-containing protein [Verrucomicrobiae bacterium]|jgi:uncharacterized protein (DUF58 family)|nr:DUF58 domain-containing protein [Verrucomicrobiae bacterium]
MPEPEPTTLLDPQAISRAEALGLNARYIVEGYMAGEHKSPYRGFAVEFAQHREYTHGDDPRHLDWKVLGRTDRYYIKQYEQETNYVAHLLLDGSESMKYGSGKLTKLHYAKVLAACLAYLILHQRDAAALALFDTTVRDYAPRSDNLASIHHLMAKLAAFEPREQTQIGAVLHDMARQLRRKGIVIIISDLFDDEQTVLEGIQHLRFGGNEVIVFQVMDPYELEFPFNGLVEFDGLEQLPKILTRPAEIRKTYLAEVEAFRRRLREGCERNQCHYVMVNTAQPWHELLSAYLAFRLRTQ